MKYRLLMIMMLMVLVFNTFGRAIDKPLIKVEFDSIDVITEKMLDQRVKQQKSMAKLYGQTPEMIKKDEVAKSLVRELLLLQYAKSLNIEVEDSYITNQINQQKKMIEQQMKRSISTEEFNKVLQSAGINLITLRANLKNVQIIQKLVNKEKSKFIANYPKATEEEVKKLFNKMVIAGRINRPVYINISHLYFQKKPDMKFDELAEIHKKITDIKNKIEIQGQPFKKMVKKYSEDVDSKKDGGVLGWTSLQDKKFLALFGEEAAYSILGMNIGDVSDVVESPVGFHLVYVNDKLPGGIPKLMDAVHPQTDVTYFSMYKDKLNEQKAEEAFIIAMGQLYDELEKDAVITFFDKDSQ